MNKDEVYKALQDFANEHKIVLEDDSQIGFGRPCVGFRHGDSFIAYNPLSYPDLQRVWPDEYMTPPPDVPDAYHKGNYMAVLVHNEDYEKALWQLYVWITEWQRQYDLEVVEYETGAVGMQALVSGVFAYAIRGKKKVETEAITP